VKKITKVAVLTPCFRETRAMIDAFIAKLNAVRNDPRLQGVQVTHYILNDGSSAIKDGDNALVNHPSNYGLALTLIDGYENLSYKDSAPDFVVRCDIDGEHNIGLLPELVDMMSRAEADAVFLPVAYSVEGQPRPSTQEITRDMGRFAEAVTDLNPEVICSLFNQKFPLGFQAYRMSTLYKIIPDLRRGAQVFHDLTGNNPTWGLDLLAILIAAQATPVSFMFAGWMTPWKENRSPEKDAEQAEKARIMIEVFKRLQTTT
jgi:hypothetical protein